MSPAFTPEAELEEAPRTPAWARQSLQPASCTAFSEWGRDPTRKVWTLEPLPRVCSPDPRPYWSLSPPAATVHGVQSDKARSTDLVLSCSPTPCLGGKVPGL